MFLTNLREFTLRKLGVDPEALRRRHPRLIVALLTAFGQWWRWSIVRTFCCLSSPCALPADRYHDDASALDWPVNHCSTVIRPRYTFRAGREGPDSARPGYDVAAFWARAGGLPTNLTPLCTEQLPDRGSRCGRVAFAVHCALLVALHCALHCRPALASP